MNVELLYYMADFAFNLEPASRRSLQLGFEVLDFFTK
jgi:hypothetical protein